MSASLTEKERRKKIKSKKFCSKYTKRRREIMQKKEMVRKQDETAVIINETDAQKKRFTAYSESFKKIVAGIEKKED